MKIITENKQARFEYFVEETYTTGIVLEGSEVKSIRAGSVNLKDSFCSVYNGEVFIKNMHIAVYDKSGAFNTKDSKRDRKLLLRKAEINKIVGKVHEKGLTLVPLNLFFEGSLVKVTMGVCKGKHSYDKKDTIKERDLKRAQEREINNYR
jgi:SsrA-binding protein